MQHVGRRVVVLGQGHEVAEQHRRLGKHRVELVRELVVGRFREPRPAA